jgi:hypothetical protein
VSKKTNLAKNSPPPDPATSTSAVLDPPENTEQELFDEAEEVLAADSEREPVPWEVWASNERIGFFELMNVIPAEAWEDSLLIYLYRLDPPVANKGGEKKYICRYAQAIDEETIKEQHGGGKYHAILKRGTDTLKNAKFSIAGEPKLLDGQVIRGSATAVAPGTGAPGAPAVPSDLGSIVRQVIEATKGDPTAANAGIRVMESAMKDGLALNKTILESQLNSTTGNKVSDRILDGLLPRLFAPPTPDPIIGEVLKAALTMMTRERKAESNPAQITPADPMSQLNFVKDLLGVDSIKELFDQGSRRGAEPFWVPLLSNAIEKLPGLFHEYAVMQQQNFERAFIAHQVRAGLPVTGQVIPPGTVVPPMVNVTPTTAAPGATAEQQQAQQMIGAVIDAICRAYDEGYPGDVAGAHLKLSYPQFAEQLRPMLMDPQQLSAFVASVPALADRAAEPEWAEFQGELVAELAQIAVPPGAEPPVSQPVRTEQVTPGAPPVVHVSGGTPKPTKQKPNGRVA